eukprot:1181616-Prorocentrum_minimum.AAC.2
MLMWSPNAPRSIGVARSAITGSQPRMRRFFGFFGAEELEVEVDAELPSAPAITSAIIRSR